MRALAEELWTAVQHHVRNLVLVEEIDSSHAMAIRLMKQMDEEGLELAPALVVAARQSTGRGRGERGWISPPGGLFLNWLSSGLDNGVVSLLPMLGAAAAHEAVAGLGVAGLGIKWPNDLLVEGAKLAGLLVHACRGECAWATVGLGINLEQAPRIDEPGALPATALAQYLPLQSWGSWVVRIGGGFVAALHRSLADPEPALARWQQHLVHRPGDEMVVRLGSGASERGSFAGLTADGFLRLDTAAGERIISSGDLVEINS